MKELVQLFVLMRQHDAQRHRNWLARMDERANGCNRQQLHCFLDKQLMFLPGLWCVHLANHVSADSDPPLLR